MYDSLAFIYRSARQSDDFEALSLLASLFETILRSDKGKCVTYLLRFHHELLFGAMTFCSANFTEQTKTFEHDFVLSYIDRSNLTILFDDAEPELLEMLETKSRAMFLFKFVLSRCWREISRNT